MSYLKKNISNICYEDESTKLEIRDYLISFMIAIILSSIVVYKVFNLFSQEKSTLNTNINSSIMINNKDKTVKCNFESLGNCREARDIVSDTHSFLNTIVGWNGSPDEDEYMECSKVADLILERDKIIDYMPLKNDLNELAKDLRIGSEKRDKTYIIKAHRIAHDLDYHFYKTNPYGIIFGVTETLGY
ncbi:hypothetical protein [Clostridium sp.]|jgi:hypothetical protein|uniref:hypothetical protein n=1 Tax=Clostridium sp. TaxID=1506 RepID=UPI0039F57300